MDLEFNILYQDLLGSRLGGGINGGTGNTGSSGKPGRESSGSSGSSGSSRNPGMSGYKVCYFIETDQWN
jgi:hypothetical protein